MCMAEVLPDATLHTITLTHSVSSVSSSVKFLSFSWHMFQHHKPIVNQLDESNETHRQMANRHRPVCTEQVQFHRSSAHIIIPTASAL